MERKICYGEYLKYLRKSRNYTILGLYKAIGLSSQYLSEIERGGRKSLNEDKAAALSETLHLTDMEKECLYNLSEEVKKRVTIPADVRAYIESNPTIIAEIQKAMDYGLTLKAG